MFGRLRTYFRTFDWLLFAGMILVAGVGLSALYSISVGRGGEDVLLFQKQLFIGGIGLFGYFIFSLVDYHTWQSTSRWIYVGTLLILILTLAFGQVINSTRGWIGVGGWVFQPVELAKLVSIIVLAAYFARQARELDRLNNLLQSFILTALFVGLIFLQPDFGSAMLILALWLGLVLIIGVKRKYLIGLVAVGLISFLLGWFVFFQPYQKERLKTFILPSDPNSAASYNVRQATIAVGSGQLLGKGLGEGSQSQLRFLPEAETDFIFAVVAEELGFMGILVLFSFFAVIYVRLFLLLMRVSDWFASFLILGSILLLSVEIFINAAMAMGMFPVVGIPFPFVSAGGSSLLVHMILFGILQNIARNESSRGYKLSRV
jgi:rod shape determining protein RodA